MKTGLFSPSTLAFMGDSVYSLLVRERLCAVNRPSGALHSMSVKLVNANAQAEAYKVIEGMLSETEIDIYKRGRNPHVSAPKNASVADYHSATGVETLFGYLYLSGNDARIKELFDIIWSHFSDKLFNEVVLCDKK